MPDGNVFHPTQTMGDALGSDGRLNGTLNVTTISCDQTANTCSIPVPAPGFALVFLTSDSLSAVSPTSTVTFPTSAVSSTKSQIYINPSILVTSNGHTGMEGILGATSEGSGSASGAASRYALLSSALTMLAAVLGITFFLRRW
jgi:hypothetical protein